MKGSGWKSQSALGMATERMFVLQAEEVPAPVLPLGRSSAAKA